ncbi:MAG: response regulator transcription factor [Acidobacteria bacterium]|nr:response regulator transcription factor [Acidobacteriota bacterium]
MKRILVIEDDSELLEGLKDNLELDGYEVLTATDGAQGLTQAGRSRPDAVILDIMLPKLSGFDLCRTLRERGFPTPILMLTARGQESDKVLGLELGADDYVTKPFSIHELLARLRAMIRRSTGLPRGVEAYRFGDVEVSFWHQQVRKGRFSVSLSALEFEVLRYLIAHRGQIVSREHLLTDVWGYQTFRTTRAVDNLVGRLRQKLEDRVHEPRHILTVHGVGYKFVE